MPGLLKVLRGMLVLRAIAAADVPAKQAKAQMHPFVINLQTILATLRARLDLMYLRQMSACLHLPFLSKICGLVVLSFSDRRRLDAGYC